MEFMATIDDIPSSTPNTDTDHDHDDTIPSSTTNTDADHVDFIPSLSTNAEIGDNGIRGSYDCTPRLNMEFDNVDKGWEFWMTYARIHGFNARKRNANKRKDGFITSAIFVCSKQGVRGKDKRDELVINPRAETRTNCPVHMVLRFRRENDKYRVAALKLEHNHDVHFPECTHLLRAHRLITDVQAQQIELADKAGLTQRQQHDLSVVQAGGRENVGYIRVDVKNYLRNKRQRDMVFGEVGALLGYFESRALLDTNFFHALQFDSDEQIANIFWADYRMIVDYELFGDVVTFDTTFSTNKEYRPLGVFLGFNHYREIVIFGAALLYDETTESFRWLFETFLKAHKSKKPATIFTDQDAAMAKALAEVMPDSRHGLCTWHLMQNAMKNVGHFMRGGTNFFGELKKLMYEYVEVEKFEECWDLLVTTHEANDNSWLKTLYHLKEKWARCYMKSTVTLGMRSTQLSESLNGDLKDYLKSTLNLDGFFKRFDKVVSDKRYKELQSEFNAREKLPKILIPDNILLIQAAKVYTPQIFESFQKEWGKSTSKVVKKCSETPALHEYIVSSYDGKDECKVTFSPSNQAVNCACNHFVTVGFLCCHALKVFDYLNIKIIPEAYILKRWTRQARDGKLEIHGLDSQGNGDMDGTDRYRIMCNEFAKIALKALHSVPRFDLTMKMMFDLNKSLDEIPNVCESHINLLPKSALAGNLHPNCKGLKKKDGRKGGKRHKSCLERTQKKRKKQGEISKTPQASSQASRQCFPSESNQVIGSCDGPGLSTTALNDTVPQADVNMNSLGPPLGDSDDFASGLQSLNKFMEFPPDFRWNL